MSITNHTRPIQPLHRDLRGRFAGFPKQTIHCSERMGQVSLLWLWLVPMVALGAFIGYWYSSKQAVARQVHQEIAELRQAGLPVDSASLAVFRKARTSSEHTDQWLELLHVDSSIFSLVRQWNSEAHIWDRYRPRTNDGPKPNIEQQWAARLKPYLDFVTPVIEKFRHLPAQEQGVWFPSNTHAYDRYYQSIDLAGLFRMELEYALVTNDHQRALAAVDDMEKLIAALEGHFSYQFERHLNELRVLQWGMWRSSLISNGWTGEELAEWLEKTKGIDLLHDWESLIHVTRAEWLIHLNQPDPRVYVPGHQWLTNPEVQQLEVLELYRKLLAAPRNSPPEFLQTVRRLSSDVSRQSLAAEMTMSQADWFLSWIVNAVEHACYVQRHLRLTRTAFALRLYRQVHGQWPKELHELMQVGLEPGEWTYSGTAAPREQVPFGYQVHEDVAYLWMGAGNSTKMPDFINIPTTRETWQQYSVCQIPPPTTTPADARTEN